MPPPSKPKTGRPGGDDFEGASPKPRLTPDMPALSGETAAPIRKDFTGVAPEVRQSRWHDRSSKPRGVLPTEAVLKGLDDALQKAVSAQGAVEPIRGQLKADWLPMIRQVVEQCGGDGLDAYITQLLYPPGRQALTTLVAELSRFMDRLQAAPDVTTLGQVAREIRALLARAMADPAARPASLDLQEKELDGRVNVDTLLSIRFTSPAELAEQRARVERTVEGLRQQLRMIPGAPPEGLLSSLFRAKVEKRVMDAEARRRDGP